MNKLTFSTIAVLVLLSSSVHAQRETKFFTSFDYEDEPIVFEPADLNGADGQIGEWSGVEIPETSGGDILDPPDAVGFRNNPYEDGGRLLVVDRPGGSIETGEDFQGAIIANLTDPILLLGAEISFEIGTRRTGGNQNKDYDIVGKGSDGAESFRVRVGTNNNGGERLGYVTDNSATVEFDLPTVLGDDRGADLNNTGYNAALEGPAAGAEFPFVKITMSQAGYIIDLAHNELNTSGDANAYTSDTLPYNGDAMDLALVEFEYSGSGATGRNSGWFLDNVLVAGFEEILQGDFDSNGVLDVNDFIILSDNFGNQTPNGDYDFDGVVTLADFAQLKTAFNSQAQGAATAAVPEPTSLTLLALGLVGFVALRRRR